MAELNTTGPAISGLSALVRQISDLRQRVEILEKKQTRYISIGTNWRIQINGTGAVSTLEAVRTSDGNTTQIAP